MDKALIAHKFSKSLKSYNQEAKAQKLIIARLVELFQPYKAQSFNSILEFGTGTGLLSKEIRNHCQYQKLFLNDLSEEFESFTLSHFTTEDEDKISFIRGDIEQVELPSQLDLVISASTEQWVENKANFYQKISNSLQEDGHFVFSTFGPDNLKQLREATGVSLKYYDLEENKKALAEQFEVLYFEEENIILKFDSAMDILTHIKKTGVNAISKQNWTKKSVMQLIKKIETVCKNEDHYEITYHPLYFILKKRS